jgi:type I restriction enzyme S subunit
MDEWKTVRLSDVCEVVRGGSPRPIVDYITDSADGVNWLKIGDVSEHDKYFTHSAEKIRIDGITKSREVKKGDLILSNSMSFGRAFITLIDGYIHDGWLRLRNDEAVLEKEYLYYFLSSDMAQNQFKAVATGSVVNNLKSDTVKAVTLSLPPMRIQREIADILSSLDDKITNNTKINHHLEQMAQAIFKNWFVDFEPFGGKKPSDWKTGSLIDIADYLNGLAMQRFRPAEAEVGLPVLKIKELRQGSCDTQSELCSPNIRSDYIVHDGDVIFSWSGSLLVDFWCGGDCGLNQHLFKVTSRKYDKWFYYAWTCHHLARFVAMAADKATTMGHIKREALENAEVIIPDEDSYRQLGGLLAPLYEQVINNRVESRKLSKLRDSLLPKLMTGEISVEEALDE